MCPKGDRLSYGTESPTRPTKTLVESLIAAKPRFLRIECTRGG
jgi:hypothetical protein